LCFRSPLLEPHFRARIFGIVSRVLREQFLGLLADDLRKRDLHLNELIAANSPGSQTGNAALTQSEPLAGLRARGNPEQALSVYSRYFNLCAKRRFGYGYWDYAINIVALALEIRVLGNVCDQVQVARPAAKAAPVALTLNSNSRTRFHSGRHPSRYGFVPGNDSFASAFRARRGNLPGPGALRALRRGAETPRVLAGAVAPAASHITARRFAGAVTNRAHFASIDFDPGIEALHRLFEFD